MLGILASLYHRAESKRARAAWLGLSTLLVTSAAAAFWIPAFRLARGLPVPLDDVYIHFGFARSLARGHPFEWVAGNGYSSGGTSLTYPFVLAPGCWLGLSGERLAIFAALLAIAATVSAMHSVRSLVSDRARPLVGMLASALLVAVPLLDWSLFSGMEIALLAAILGRALVAVRAVERSFAWERARLQLRAGVWIALLVATRPETIALAIPLAVSVVHAARSRSTWSSLLRGAGPTVVFLGAQAIANRLFTGEWTAAGAVRKLLLSNPYSTPLEVALEVLKNLAALRLQAFEIALGGLPGFWIALIFAAFAIADRSSRRLAISLAIGASGAMLLVSLNATARFQNLRYAAPSLLMVLMLSALGASSLWRRAIFGKTLTLALLALALVLPARAFPRQIDHYARASRNIREQQVEMAHRVRARSPRRVLVGDAGAIPYLSGAGAIDGLGLGGFRGLPFARASVHGVPAVVELIERLSPADRPDFMALYPSWWPGLADVFGKKVDSVRIEDNVICGADEKVLYEADWSLLASSNDDPQGTIDALDVADLVDERAHDAVIAAPRGAWVIGAAHALSTGARRYDAGRITPQGRSESFRVRAPEWTGGPATLVVRTDEGGDLVLRISIERDGREHEARSVAMPERRGDLWFSLEAPLDDVKDGDRVVLYAEKNAWRGFHSWIVRSAAWHHP